MMLSRTLRLAVAASTLLGLSACSDDAPPPPECFVIGSQPPPVTGLGLFLSGQQVTVDVMPFSSSCGIDDPQPTSVTAEVEGPSGEPVAHQIELGERGLPSVLTFTPERPGPHHILVAFSQVGGIHQFDFLVASDRTAETSSTPLPGTCGSLERTLQGAWVCDTRVLRDRTSARVFSSSSRLAVSGDVIWVVGSSTVERYVDTGTELLLTGSLSHLQSTPEFLVAVAEELVVLHQHSLVRYTFQDGDLEAGAAEPWTRPIAQIQSHSPYAALVRNGDWLAVATRARLGNDSAVQVCRHQLLSGRFQRAPGECLLLPGEIYGFEPGILWTKDPPVPAPSGLTMGLIRRWVWAQGQLQEQGSLSIGANIVPLATPLMRPSAVPIVARTDSALWKPYIAGVVTWVPRQKTLVLEALDTKLFSPYASHGFYWGTEVSSSTSSTWVRIRPPVP
ncbi:hypothetical protein [Hyalangium gracile]|uniref:hypothetical protein n=1 Tax=Hyalangium gracile TaxID=394092 RepID=UPI001CCA2500|nr:hypothetical protein [Hyalangium gracile]